LVLHPKSRGSAREWGLENFSELIRLLPQDRFKVFISGTAAEGALMESLFRDHPFITDLTGRLSLGELVAFLARVDGLVAASTGPLHLAAALGIHALGIYPPIRPMHPGRWSPVGRRAKFFVKNIDCAACRKTSDCTCIRGIPPKAIQDYLVRQSLNKR
jgi:ADP-heptose:LPS heptosyltransferase